MIEPRTAGPASYWVLAVGLIALALVTATYLWSTCEASSEMQASHGRAEAKIEADRMVQ